MATDQANSVLIVDDNAQIRRVLRLQLQRFGWQCDEASDGSQALSMVAEKRYRLVLMDIGMPAMDGFSCLSKLRNHPDASVRQSKVFAVTGQSSEAECRSRGFDGFLQKPVLLADIERTLSVSAHTPLAAR